MPKFAANLTMMYNEVDFVSRFAEAARSGFKAVEFLFPYAYDKTQLAEECAKHQLKVVMHNFPAGDWDNGERGLTCLPDRVNEFQDAVGLGIEYAKALSCDRMHCPAGSVPREGDLEMIHQTYIDNLQYAAAQTKKAGIKLLIEPISTRSIPDFYLRYSQQAFDVIRETNSDNIFWQCDIYHLQVMEGDIATKLEKNLALLGHVQISDTPGRHEPGTGEINYPFIFAHLDKIGYQGWVGCEYKPVAGTEAGLGWIKGYLKN
jgi:hydroxypyruvate isomerase